MKVPTFFILLSFLFFSDGAKILGVFYMPSRSHYILGNALMKGLAEKGHDVTIITPFIDKKPPKNGTYRQIELTGLPEEMEKHRQGVNFYELENIHPAIIIPIAFYMMYGLSESTLNHPNVQNLLKSQEKFDVVIVEEALNEAQKGFASHFDAPLVLLSSIGANHGTNMLVGNPSPPSYVPEATLSYSSSMTLYERTVNSLMQLYSYVFFNLIAFPFEKRLFDRYFPKGPGFYDVLYNSSLVLLNSHPSLNQPVPYVPNMVDIGGYHIQRAKELPKDLQKFLDDAKEGVIYFSMGSNLKSSELPPEKRDAFLKTFSKLKQKVLWKWEEDVLDGQPKNVKLGKWLPQQEILAHPNVKLFITHGGLLSTTETIYHGVPALALPIVGDQKLNAQRILTGGFGLVLYYNEISEETLTENIRVLLDDPKYFQNAKKRSAIFHDRPTKPMDTATYWVEYVIRHRGAPHLRVAGVDLPWYQYLLLDVLAVILMGVYIFYKVVKFLLSLCSKPKSQKLKKN